MKLVTADATMDLSVVEKQVRISITKAGRTVIAYLTKAQTIALAVLLRDMGRVE